MYFVDYTIDMSYKERLIVYLSTSGIRQMPNKKIFLILEALVSLCIKVVFVVLAVSAFYKLSDLYVGI